MGKTLRLFLLFGVLFAFPVSKPARVEARGPYECVPGYYYSRETAACEQETCPPGAETCSGTLATSGRGQWKTDLRGALVNASWRFMQRDAKVTSYIWAFVDLVEGHRLQMTNNADQSRTFASVHMHENKLYILEATAPRGRHGQEQFQQSLGWLDENGVGLRYRDVYNNADIYLNGHPPPGRFDRTGTDSQAGQGRIDAPR